MYIYDCALLMLQMFFKCDFILSLPDENQTNFYVFLFFFFFSVSYCKCAVLFSHHYENTPIQIYIENFSTKKGNFLDKKKC